MIHHAFSPIRHLRGAFSALAVLGSLLAATSQAATNLITNGNFEATVLPTGSYNHVAGSTGITGWTVGGTNVQIVSAGYAWLWTGNNTQWVDLTGTSGGGYIEQTFPTTAGKVYRASIRTFNGSASFSYATFGSSSTPFAVTATGNNPLYASVTPGTEATVVYQFTATGASTTLRITETTNGDSNAGWIDDVSVEEVVPTVFGSGISTVTAWDPIFPDVAYASPAALSTPTQTVGPLPDDPRWTNPHAASVFPKNTHPWENIAPMNFNANWINAWSNITSRGPNGQSWTKYSTTVTGEGSFVLQFLADNVSWIYLDGVIVGYQDWNWSSVGTGRYTINLTGAGPHELVFIIWDGGGAAGGKFRIETLQSFVSNGGGTPPPPPKPADTTAPVIVAPVNVTQEATSAAGAVVTFTATATDNVDGTVPVVASPASGSVFPIATTPVGLAASDKAGNTATASFNVTVRDTTKPVVTVPANLTVEASSAAGATVSYSTPTATDAVGVTSLTSLPASGSTFALGTTSVNVSAADAAGNIGTGSFTVTVRDTTAPAVTVPANITAEATSATGATVNYPAATATDAVGVTSLTSSQASGTVFPIGTTTVNVTAKDAAGNTTVKSFTVTVRDTTAPGVTATMTPRGGGDDESAQFFTLAFTATDAVGVKTLTAVLNGVTVTNGQVVQLQTIKSGAQSVKRDDGKLQIKATSFALIVTATDAAGNTTTKTIVPVFVKNGKDDEDKKSDDRKGSDDNGKDK